MDGATSAEALPTPRGLQPCASADPVARAEAGVAAKLGGAYLGCFKSEQPPVEYALAVALPDRGYKLADLDNMLSVVRQQWKDFDPLGKEFKDAYIARLNELIKSNGSEAPPSIISVKPTLVSIERGSGNYYTVTSIRTYVVDHNGSRITATKINSDAVVLRGSQLIRLTMQRPLSDSADVAQVEGEIADWARMFGAS